MGGGIGFNLNALWVDSEGLAGIMAPQVATASCGQVDLRLVIHGRLYYI